jgi:acyl-coenzyme A synthetase/AMP-(fatty) acid ligase
MRTSGSLGAPKMVRLSFSNLRVNAMAIAEALELRASDRGMTSLPLDFSFGLSLANSHLAAGASVALSAFSPSSQPFWQYLDDAAATCVGAVPSTYRFLRGRGWDPRAHPSLRLLLLSGGPLDEATLAHFGALMSADGGEFVSMYGQTEATARIAVLPAALAAGHRGAVGLPVPGGKIRIERPGGSLAADGEAGEIVYEGPNVMMGYAYARADLAKGWRQSRALRTGDLGLLRDGVLYVRGRMDRQVKVFGRRIDLAHVERLLLDGGITAAVEAVGDERLVVASELAADRLAAVCRSLATSLGLPPSAVRAVHMDALPCGHRGKIDHAAVRRAADTA